MAVVKRTGYILAGIIAGILFGVIVEIATRGSLPDGYVGLIAILAAIIGGLIGFARTHSDKWY